MAKNIYTLRKYKLKINDKIVWYFMVKDYKVGYSLLSAYNANKKAGMLLPCTEYFLENKKSGINHIHGLEKMVKEDGDEVYDIRVHGLLHNYNWEYDEETETNIGTLKEQ